MDIGVNQLATMVDWLDIWRYGGTMEKGEEGNGKMRK